MRHVGKLMISGDKYEVAAPKNNECMSLQATADSNWKLTCAHWPRFAERPPHASDEKHCPEYDTQRAPCTNTSTSAAVFAAVAAISSTVSSRPSTTRAQPRLRANSAPSPAGRSACSGSGPPWQILARMMHVREFCGDTCRSQGGSVRVVMAVHGSGYEGQHLVRTLKSHFAVLMDACLQHDHA